MANMQRMINNLEHNFIKFDEHEIITILDNVDKLWFCGIDVANALDYRDAKKQFKEMLIRMIKLN